MPVHILQSRLATQQKRLTNRIDQKRSDLFTTPSLLRTLYKVGNVVNKSPGNSQSVVQFIGQFYASVDLDLFFDLFFSTASGQAPKIVRFTLNNLHSLVTILRLSQ
jgi:hypothetical protein